MDHPVYSNTEAEWHSIRDLSEFGDIALADIILSEQTRIAQFCTKIFGSFLRQEVLGTETLVPNDLLVKPMENDKRGFVAYLEFVLPSAKPYDSDSWWMIVGCPDTTRTFSPEIRYNPWSFGWFCQ